MQYQVTITLPEIAVKMVKELAETTNTSKDQIVYSAIWEFYHNAAKEYERMKNIKIVK